MRVSGRFVVIVDMESQVIGIVNENEEWELAIFESVEEIEELKKEHGLSMFDWHVLNLTRGTYQVLR